MQVTPEQGSDWRDWLLLTSIPLVHIGEREEVLAFGSGTMLDFEGRRFLVTAGHVATIDSKGWAIVVQQHSDGRLEFYRPNAFVHIGEGRRSTSSLRLLDLCVAQVAANLETWYEFRTPHGLFDKRPHHVFEAATLACPEQDQIYGFSGRVRTEMHAPGVFASEMTVFPGLSYLRTEQEEHVFSLPVAHPGHDAFHGSSGSPVCDFSRRLLSIMVRGNAEDSTVRGVAVERVLPALQFLAAQTTMQVAGR
ncbi:hypothetical protein [Duganella aceris]|uniref:Serine protease n=1 Tax=Duganella aceris TaxID=2703883 RepID=A0ABX0FV91_9BURK|nr:hypothetical protein [Duganella aceris]NGZ88631.1 hypothetical protein [Duganella aceris]